MPDYKGNTSMQEISLTEEEIKERIRQLSSADMLKIFDDDIVPTKEAEKERIRKLASDDVLAIFNDKNSDAGKAMVKLKKELKKSRIVENSEILRRLDTIQSKQQDHRDPEVNR